MGSETSDDPSPSPPSSIPRVTPAKARNIASGLKRLADEYTEIGMHHEAHSMMRGSEWWLAYAEKEARVRETDHPTLYDAAQA